jgi:hypothetical protein
MNTKLAANYGTISGLIAFAYFVILASNDLNPLGNWKFIASIIPIYFIYAGVKKHRNENFGGYIKYGQAFSFSLAITFFYATTFAALVYIYGKAIDTDIVGIVKADTLQQVDKLSEVLGDDSKMVDKAVSELEKMTIGSLAMGEYWNKIIWGFILGLIVSAFLKKEKPMFEE